MHKTFLALSVSVLMTASLAADCDGKCPVPQKVRSAICALNPITFIKQHKTGTVVTGCVLACAWYAYKNGFFGTQEEEQE